MGLPPLLSHLKRTVSLTVWKEGYMLEHLMKLYVMAMTGDVRSPTPHLFGPPGSGKSSVCQQLADLVSAKLHTINVSRISPLDLEGVQMPVDNNTRLDLLHATWWTSLKDNDVVLFDEFLRGFPEVYNGLLDIFTSREVGGFKLPKVFILAASNSTIAYDKALEDRLLHIPVPDPRSDRRVYMEMVHRFVDELGLLPEMAKSAEMRELFDQEVFPMYAVLDQLAQHKPSTGAEARGSSMRKLIGQAQLREVQSPQLRSLLEWNNSRAMRADKPQYVLLLDGTADPQYQSAAKALQGDHRLTPIQARNLDLNLQLLELEELRLRKEVPVDESLNIDDLFD